MIALIWNKTTRTLLAGPTDPLRDPLSFARQYVEESPGQALAQWTPEDCEMARAIAARRFGLESPEHKALGATLWGGPAPHSWAILCMEEAPGG